MMVLRRKENITHIDDPVLTGPVPKPRAAPFRAEPTVSSLASHSLATEVGAHVDGEIRAEMRVDGFRAEMSPGDY